MRKVLWHISVAGLLTLSGCVGVALPVPSLAHKVASGHKIESTDLAFIRVAEATQSEVENRLGAPSEFYPDLSVAAYRWETISGYLLYAWAFLWSSSSGDNADAGAEEIIRTHVLLVHYDVQDRVRMREIMHQPNKMTTRQLATRWRQAHGSKEILTK